MKRTSLRWAFLLLCLLCLCQNVSAARLLVPGGQVIGLALTDDSVTVAAFDETLGAQAQAQGLQIGDRILQIDGRKIGSAEDVRQALEHSDGTVQLQISRKGKEKQLHLTPQITAQGPRLGVFLKQGVTGIGTVTWYDPESGDFGALGHGVNDAGGRLIDMRSGRIYASSVLSVRPGKVGDPGQLRGTLGSEEAIGRLEKNAVQGVFGNAKGQWSGQSLPVATADQIHTGSATIRSTIDRTNTLEYSVEILKIYPNSGSDGRNMLLRVTDERLLSATGGIVQGMSGSPIIQDGKLVGAVTHVLVNDPTTGYGIFIENMLDSAA